MLNRIYICREWHTIPRHNNTKGNDLLTYYSRICRQRYSQRLFIYREFVTLYHFVNIREFDYFGGSGVSVWGWVVWPHAAIGMRFSNFMWSWRLLQEVVENFLFMEDNAKLWTEELKFKIICRKKRIFEGRVHPKNPTRHTSYAACLGYSRKSHSMTPNLLITPKL